MEFRSSYEQSTEVLCGIKSQLTTRGGKYHGLYLLLIANDTTRYRMESVLQMSIGTCISLLLTQYQTSLFLGTWNYTEISQINRAVL